MTESLAGRMGTIRLRTLAEGEVRGVEPTFVARAFGRDFPATVAPLDRRGVLELAINTDIPDNILEAAWIVAVALHA